MKNNFLLRTLICGTDELPPLTCISHVLFKSLGSLGGAAKTHQNSIYPSLFKNHIYVEKINLITRSISKFISLIYFSIKITIKETNSKKRGSLKTWKQSYANLTRKDTKYCIIKQRQNTKTPILHRFYTFYISCDRKRK